MTVSRDLGRRARMLGLDAPSKVEATFKVELVVRVWKTRWSSWGSTTPRSGPCSGGGCASSTPCLNDRPGHTDRQRARRALLARTTAAPIRAVLYPADPLVVSV